MKPCASPVWIYAQNCCNYQHHNCARCSEAYIEYVHVYVTICPFAIWIIWRRCGWWFNFTADCFGFRFYTLFFFEFLFFFFKCLILKFSPLNQSMLPPLIFFIWCLVFILLYYCFFFFLVLGYFIKYNCFFQIYFLTLDWLRIKSSSFFQLGYTE